MANPLEAPRGASLRSYAEAALLVAGATLIGLAIAPDWGNSAVDLLFLPAVLAAAVLGGLGPSLFAALASALAYNFFFTAPHFSFRVDNPSDVVTVIALFGVAAVTSHLAASVRGQARIAAAHAARNATIAGLARGLLGCATRQEIANVAVRQLAQVFDCNAVLVAGLPEPQPLASVPATVRLTPGDVAVAALVLEVGDRAGRGVDRSIPTDWQFHPVRSGEVAIAATGLARSDGGVPVRRDQLPLLDNLLDQLALALERGRLEEDARAFDRVRERDRVRSVLLATIGQDVTPPIEAIKVAVTGLRRSGTADRKLVSTLAAESRRLERYVENLTELGSDTDQQPIAIDGVAIDLFRREVRRDGVDVHLTPKEFLLLAELARHPGRVLSHGHLLRTVWGPAHEAQIDYLRVAIRGLRQKLERDPSHPDLIVNEPAVGYRLKMASAPMPAGV